MLTAAHCSSHHALLVPRGVQNMSNRSQATAPLCNTQRRARATGRVHSAVPYTCERHPTLAKTIYGTYTEILHLPTGTLGPWVVLQLPWVSTGANTTRKRVATAHTATNTCVEHIITPTQVDSAACHALTHEQETIPTHLLEPAACVWGGLEAQLPPPAGHLDAHQAITSCIKYRCTSAYNKLRPVSPDARRAQVLGYLGTHARGTRWAHSRHVGSSSKRCARRHRWYAGRQAASDDCSICWASTVKDVQSWQQLERRHDNALLHYYESKSPARPTCKNIWHWHGWASSGRRACAGCTWLYSASWRGVAAVRLTNNLQECGTQTAHCVITALAYCLAM